MSRSQLYATALRAYIDRFRDEHTTQLLDEVYAKHMREPDPFLARAASIILKRS